MKDEQTAKVLRQIADEIERVGVERAHEGFEVRDTDDGRWLPMIPVPAWVDAHVRPRPRTIQIGDHTVPEPLRVAPEVGTTFYTTDLEGGTDIGMEWDNDPSDLRDLKRGMVHLDPESAAQHARALIAVSGGEVGE